MLNQLLWLLLSGYLNLGLAVGLACGALLLLRPLLKRVLSPRQRLLLWMTAWFSAYTLQGYQLLSYLHVLPVTFRDLITPRTMENLSFDRVPAYFPDCQWDQQINLALPGGSYVPLSLEPWMAPLAGAVLLGGVVLLTLYFSRRSEGIKAQASQGRLLDWDGPELKPFYGLKPADDYVLVRLCRGLPTSFVYQKAEKLDGIKYNMIYLQEELPPERMALVLRHELNHLKRNHTWMKGIITCGLVLHWWNPLIWLAYKYTCLDLEMDCDRFTLEQLSPQNCREYARTLVELGAGKQLWDAPLAFGESDGAARVKAAVTWKKRTVYVQEAWKQKNFWLRLPGFLLFLLLLLFFVGGPSNVVLPADVDIQITEQFGSQENFLQQELDRLGLPDSVTVQQGWRSFQQTWFFDAVYQLSDGRWVESSWYRYSDGTWSHMGWDWLSSPPDLAGYTAYYP
ncbi:M56 family metallopeptidase [Pseudoflavonifractor sp. An184]|uniref:M56 family metallopeptidase n=1 Tax=Pseudoflavonifractor sp. An184 TaxID=1965576 RepID=UPI000B39EAF3|nr:M56 family metallopeptidase [Pseudoflavonifractor sp. An184]OUP56778.1 hypothetical protein B5F19_05845 [Pseudoflavonifractor sp. An184]